MITRKWLAPLVLFAAVFSPQAVAQVASGPCTNITPDMPMNKTWNRLGANGTKVCTTDNAGGYNGTATWQDIYMMDLDGSNRQRVSVKLLASEEFASVSADGNRVLMHSFSTNGNSTGATDIWTYDLVNKTAMQMTVDNPVNTIYDAFPCWSANGDKIAFMSQRQREDATIQDYQIWMIKSDKPENTTDNIPVQLTNFKGTTAAKGIGNRIWFIDNDRFLFIGKQSSVSYTIGTTTTYPYEIYIGDAADTNGDKTADNLIRITNTFDLKKTNGSPATIFDPTYAMGRVFFWADLSPDGKWHMFSLDPSGVNKDVWQVTSAPYAEPFGTAQGEALVVRMESDDNSINGIGLGANGLGMYQLVQDTGPGSASGTLVCNTVSSASAPAVGYLVTLYNGATVIATTLTDADGKWTFTNLRPGGYYVQFKTDPANSSQLPISTVGRGFVVPPSESVTVPAFTATSASPRQRGVMATIEGPNVVVRWQPDAESGLLAGYTYQGFNVYRSDTENGPWAKIADMLPKSATNVYEYTDTTATDLTKSFYTVTGVTSNGTNTVEGTFADFSQAANNLVANGSYETSDSNGLVGWFKLNGTGVDNTMVADASDKVSGSQSLLMQAGPTKTGGTWAHSQTQVGGAYQFYCIPTTPFEAYVSGAYYKWTGTTQHANNTGYTTLAYSISEPNGGIPYWYDPTVSPAGGAFRSNVTSGPPAGQTSTAWNWLYNVQSGKAYPWATYTRFSTFAQFQDSPENRAGAKVFMDEAHYQAKRVGAGGIISGRVVDTNQNGVAGVIASDGARSVETDAQGFFHLRNVPTGAASLTLNYPGQAQIAESVSNIGGYRFPYTHAYTSAIPIIVGGRVILPGGQPAAGAQVRIVIGNISTTGSEDTFTATADANGDYTFDFGGTPPDGTKTCWVVATKAGYQSAYLTNRSLAKAGRTSFNLTLGAATPLIEVARTAAAPTIDGTVGPTEWQGSALVTLPYLVPGTNAPAAATRAYMLWDNDNLYVGVVSDEPNTAGIVAAATGDDYFGTGASVWADDNVELFLDPTVSAAVGYGREVWQLGANANAAAGYSDGTLRTGPLAQTLRNVENIGGLTVASKVNPESNTWSCEIQVPFAGLSASPLTVDPPTTGTEWRGMLGRFRKQDSQNSASAVVSSGAFSSAQLWNTLKFVNAITPPTAKGDLNGDNQVTAADATIAMAIAGGLDALGSRITQGDVDGNAKVDILDASRILRKVNGLETAW